MKKFVKIGFKNGQTIDVEGDFDSFAENLNNARNSLTTLLVAASEFVIAPEEVAYALPAIQQGSDEVLTKDQIEKIIADRTKDLKNLVAYFENMTADSATVGEIIEATEKPDFSELTKEEVTPE